MTAMGWEARVSRDLEPAKRARRMALSATEPAVDPMLCRRAWRWKGRATAACVANPEWRQDVWRVERRCK